jgi:hypothetical protein
MDQEQVLWQQWVLVEVMVGWEPKVTVKPTCCLYRKLPISDANRSSNVEVFMIFELSRTLKWKGENIACVWIELTNRLTNRPTDLTGHSISFRATFLSYLRNSHILWDLKVHCCVNNSLPLVHILSLVNSVHAVQSYFTKISF